ncbi:MAG: diaminopimelate decarboxylase [Bacteroidota bacterium]|jgi:diaminopimelate decarboxylase
MSHSLSNQQLLAAANSFGTPLYVYDAANIEAQYNALTTAFAGQDVKFFYASKALTNINILKLMRNMGCAIDCSSINEAHLAIKAGHAPENILYTSNGIHFSEIETAVSLGIHVNIDSLSNLEKFGKKFGGSYPVGIRLRPNIMAGGNLKISTGHDKSKFGVPLEQLDQLLTIVETHNINIAGLHIHTGSEIKDVSVFMKVTDVFFDLVPKFPSLQFLDLGGGFKVPYKAGDASTNIPALASEIQKFQEKLKNTYGRGFELWFEPGKYMVSKSGYFITEVNVIKQTPTITFAGVNSGFNHLIRPMFYEAYHEIKNLSNPDGALNVYDVVGNICETDTFASDRQIATISEGDLLVFENAGAYGFEMASNFNSRYKPAEVLIINGEAKLIRQRDTFEDLTRNQVEVL